MDEIIKAIGEALQMARDKCNAAIKDLPPLEQVEAASELGYGLRALKYAAQNIQDNFDSLNSKISAMAEKFKTAVDAKAKELAETLATEKATVLLQEKLSSGEYMKKSDAEAAAEAKANTRETEVRAQIQTLATRRAEIAAIIPAELASRLSDALVMADNYKESAGKVKGRLDKLTEIKASVPSLQQEAASLALDEKGDAEFENRVKLIQEISQTNSGNRSGGSAPAPLAGAGASGRKPAKLAIA